MLCASMDQTLVTNAKHNKILKKDCTSLCWLCQQKDKMVQYIVSSCCKLAVNKYTKHYNEVLQYISWSILNEKDINVPNQWYKHLPSPSVADCDKTITWDLKMDMDVCLNIINQAL
eukprot:8271886-Ditylum_brightwellii.AAC.1